MQSRTASEEPCGARWRSGSVPHFGRTALLLGVNLSDGRLRHQTRANTEGPAFVPITNFGVRPRVPRPPNTRTGRERPFRSRSPRPVVYWGAWNGDMHATSVSGKDLWSTFIGIAPKPKICPYNLATQGVVGRSHVGTLHVLQ
jgi:hypothetical protein